MGPDPAIPGPALDLDLQITPEIRQSGLFVPEQALLEHWVARALTAVRVGGNKQLTVRIVDEPEITQLNETYRRKSGATNVLSFPFEAPPGVPLMDFLGDIVICAPVVQREAREQHKAAVNHWAHLVVHGTLHLLGYDHVSEPQADEMEAMEIAILSDFGIPNPYGETHAL